MDLRCAVHTWSYLLDVPYHSFGNRETDHKVRAGIWESGASSSSRSQRSKPQICSNTEYNSSLPSKISDFSAEMMNQLNEFDQEIDEFDRIPDVIVLKIFNQLSDIKTLTSCRAVSKRFNSLVPQAETLLVKVDCVISSETGEWFLLNLIKSILQSLSDFISSTSKPQSSLLQPRIRSSPTEILRGFERIRNLEIELPSGDLKLEKGTVLRWKAVFGKTLKSCVILAVRKIEEDGEEDQDGDGDGGGDEIDFYGDGGGSLKLRVIWTISALIAASARHYLLKEVIKEHKEIESLILRDREGEGTVIMDEDGLKESRDAAAATAQEEEEEEDVNGNCTVESKNRTTIPAVRMRMRHEPKLELSGGVRMKGATLIVVRPIEGELMKIKKSEKEEQKEDMCYALGAFDGVFGEAVEALIKKRSYLLEMNKF